MFIFDVNSINFSIAFLDKISMWINIPLHQYISFSNAKFVVDEISIIYIIFFTCIVVFTKNSMFYYMNNKLTLQMIIIGVLAFSYSIVNSFFTSTEVFLYFKNFYETQILCKIFFNIFNNSNKYFTSIQLLSICQKL